ncbi:MAG: carbohydrate kinase, partial [Mogibacterium sp.]|nr:carbohydrate kinase [Mogibacterium sp.]
MAYVIAYDIGTTVVKTCIFDVGSEIRYVAGESAGYPLYIGENGEAEQDPDEWWAAMCQTTRAALRSAGLQPEQIEAISFCSQMQGLVRVDRAGTALRRAMSYMDLRARAELAACMGGGLQIAGGNAVKVLTSLRINCATSVSVKDPIWKYKWVEAHEPEVFSKVHRWLDVKDYLVSHCTGDPVMTEDSAFATMIADTRQERMSWSERLCTMYGVHTEHLAPIIKVTDRAGTLTPRAAEQLGLAEGTPVFGGGGDASLVGVGAGCVKPGQTHIYSGTSGWVSTVVDKQLVDPTYMIASPVGAVSGCYNYFAEMETAGKCLEWARDHLALDEVGVYLEARDVTSGSEAEYTTLYDYMSDVIR